MKGASYASTTQRPNRNRCGGPKDRGTAHAPRSHPRGVTGRTTHCYCVTGVRPESYGAMIANLRCATSTSIGDNRTARNLSDQAGGRQRLDAVRGSGASDRRPVLPGVAGPTVVHRSENRRRVSQMSYMCAFVRHGPLGNKGAFRGSCDLSMPPGMPVSEAAWCESLSGLAMSWRVTRFPSVQGNLAWRCEVAYFPFRDSILQMNCDQKIGACSLRHFSPTVTVNPDGTPNPAAVRESDQPTHVRQERGTQVSRRTGIRYGSG